MDRAAEIRAAYQAYAPALVRKAGRMLGSRDGAEDIVHALFADLFAKGKSKHCHDLSYLYRAVTNRCLNLIRDESRRAELLGAQDLEPAVSRAEGRAISVQLLGSLARVLSKKEIEILVCRYIDDMSQEEIAEHLGTSRKTVGKKLQRARTELERLAGGQA